MAFLGVDLIVLRVRNLARSEAFYTERFGVRVTPGVLPTARTLFLAGGPHVDLVEGESPDNPAASYVQLRMVVDDLEATYQLFLDGGVTVIHPPTQLPRGAKEMVAADLDGYRWRFTEPQKPRS